MKTKEIECPQCKGDGMFERLLHYYPWPIMKFDCDYCNGTGKMSKKQLKEWKDEQNEN